MPKMKTRSAAKKRFTKVGNGKIVKCASGYRRHLFTSKTSKRKRQLRKTAYIHEADLSSVLRLLPY
jgi:large subunit ribosomal protein L35